jgi:hypothetical protein
MVWNRLGSLSIVKMDYKFLGKYILVWDSDVCVVKSTFVDKRGDEDFN